MIPVEVDVIPPVEVEVDDIVPPAPDDPDEVDDAAFEDDADDVPVNSSHPPIADAATSAETPTVPPIKTRLSIGAS